ncbi:substrate-binding domain-containing protein [Trinickia acidisoli]|uniref:substrate-binding domain-containing protein n=1 Tax=Trinickia acidisoli TaxID=2767482 RepID=UPI001A8D0F85|nr:substrate-binding domain-containing protein [Trinickia acidisoli]
MKINRIEGAPLSGISSMATRHVLAELVDDYERRWGQRVRIESVGGVDAARRVSEGEPFDIVVLAADAIDRLTTARRIDPTSRIDLARSGMAIAVARGAPHPGIGTQAAMRDTLLAARRIGYSTGPSGTHLLSLFERLGIAETMASRIVQVPPGVPVGSLLANGEVELGFQQLSELMHLRDIEVVGSLPPETQSFTVFRAAVCTVSTCKDAAKALLSFLASPSAAPAIRRHGMEPMT